MKKDEDQNEKDEPEIVEEEFGSEPEKKFKKLKAELKECRKKADEYLGGWQRAKADLINARKDEEKNRQALVQYANENLLYETLAVLDSFEKALSDETLDHKWKTGFQHIKDQLVNIMRSFGLEEIEAGGKKFNPAEHESIMEEAVSDQEKNQVVLEEMQKGYKIHDKVLRPARVKIGIYKNNKN